MIDWINEELTK